MSTRLAAADGVLVHQQDWWLPANRQQVWDAIERFDSYPLWWSWLAEFHAEGDGLGAGLVMAGRVEPPVPYPFHLTVTVVDCTPPYALSARVDGDVTGSASIRLDESSGQTCVACTWTLRMVSRSLRLGARLAPPVMRWGHDRVVERTVRSFAINALASDPGRVHSR